MTEIEFSLATVEDKPALIAAVKAILNEGESHNAAVFNQQRWEWQYEKLPGFSLNYIGKVGDEILAYYHIPVYKGKIGGIKENFAMVQDVAVSDRLRGQGIFRRLATFATEDLKKKNIPVAYTFPNDKSIHTFLKYNNYKHLLTYGAYILPVNSKSIISDKTGSELLAAILTPGIDIIQKLRGVRLEKGAVISKQNTLSNSAAELFLNFSKEYEIGLIRNAEYLQWRFLEKPGTEHFFIEFYLQNELKSVAVFKKDIIFKRPCLLLMDFAYCNNGEKYLLQLIQLMRDNKFEFLSDADLIFTSGFGKIFSNLYKAGFLTIHAKLNPRPLKLLVNNLHYQGKPDLFRKESWHATLADWDVF